MKPWNANRTTVVGLLMLLVSLAVACGDGSKGVEDEAPAQPAVGETTPTGSSPPTALEIGQALEAAEGSEVTVSGFLIADRDGNTRLCSLVAESLPPQCGGDWIYLMGFDASSVPNSKTLQRPSEIPTVRWTDNRIIVTGIKGIGGLAEVQLAPTTQQGPGAPASVDAIAPNLRLTFEGVEYIGVEILGAASPDGPIVCCGTPIDMDDMRVVGAGIQHNPVGDDTARVHRPKADATTDVFTFHPAQVEGASPEDEADTTPATWIRWIVD